MSRCYRNQACRVLWTLWLFLPSDRFDEEGKMIPRAVWLCSRHYADWTTYMEQLSNNQEDDSLSKKPALMV